MYLNYLKYLGAVKNKGCFVFVFFACLHPLESYAETNVEKPQTQTKSDKVVRVAVTGSRISKAQKDGPTSVTVITAADIEKQGYTNAFDALNNLAQNTGFVQGADFGNIRTPAANAISLRGLGPNYTLTLINGHRVADYPVAYEGNVNFVNLANIPTAIIDRIEILNGGASAIYGSDAIAGVVNIILKKKTDGTQFNIKAGGTKDGGESLRLQLSGSNSLDKLNLVYGLEFSAREPIFATDRHFMSTSTKNGEAPTTIVGRRNAETGQYLPIGGEGCQPYEQLFKGAVHNFAKNADRCASDRVRSTYWSVQTQNRSQNGYLGLDYELNEKTQLFADVLIGANQIQNNTRSPTWTSLGTNGYFLNQNSGNYEIWNRAFAPEEFGGLNKVNKKWQEFSSNLNFGIRGDIADSSWNYEAEYNGSIYTSNLRNPINQLAGIDEYFLGSRLGVDKDGVPIYAPDLKRLNQPLNPSEITKVYGTSEQKDRSWVQSVSISANGDVFELPAGTAKLAAIAEVGRQGFKNRPDKAFEQGRFNTTSYGEYGGARSRQALGTELFLPLAKPLNLTLSGRYDRYALSDNSIDKFTFGSGLEFRPDPTLLLRGNYQTSFRAPDMNYLFLNKQKGYYSSTTDYLRCEQTGQPLSNCEFRLYSPGADYIKVGNKDLKPENGKSYGFGFVWSPVKAFDLSVDYWNIQIDDQVTNLSADKLLRTEADCRAGRRNINDTQCTDALARIERNPIDAVVNPNVIRNINIVPINAASVSSSGIDLTSKWRWKTDYWGNFLWSVNYSRTLKNKYQQSKEDPADNLLWDKSNLDWRDRFNSSLSWNRGPFESTVLLSRYGKLPKADESGWLNPMYIVNWSGTYQISSKASASIIVNNLLDKEKLDYTGGWAYYATGYPLYGRQAWLEFNYKF